MLLLVRVYAIILSLSRGAVNVLETTPPIPPAQKKCHKGNLLPFGGVAAVNSPPESGSTIVYQRSRTFDMDISDESKCEKASQNSLKSI